MKKVIILILCMILLCSCSSGEKIADNYKATYKTINYKETKKLLKEGNTVLIDVRTSKEYKKKHLKKAINIPYKNIDTIINEVSKDSVVVIYGTTKKQSKDATNKVIDTGYSLVYDLGSYNDIK